jgi:EmrB/QacA subfamily drug resistance transporter
MEKYPKAQLRPQLSEFSIASSENGSIPSIEEDVVESRMHLPAKQMIMIFIGLASAQFLAAIDATIVATAIPRIGSDFNSLDRAPWIATAYLLTYNAFHAIFASLSDSFGRKPIILLGIAIFVVFSALCAAATNLEMLIMMRAMQGVGGSAIYAMFNIIPADLVPIHQRGMWQGASNSLWAVAAVAGPLAGGFFTDRISWRYAFLINVPIGFFAMIIIILYLQTPEPESDSDKSQWLKLDYPGIVLTILFSVIFLVAFTLGGTQFPWISWPVLGGFSLSVVFLGLLFIWELRYAVEPLFPARIFKGRTLLLMYLMNFTYTAAFYMVLYYTPLFYQVVKGDTAANSGVKLIPIELCLTTAGVVAGLIQQRFFVYRPLLIFGTTVFTIGLGLFSLLDVHTTDALGYAFVCISGIGLGFIFSSNIIAVQSAVDDRDMGIATGMVTYFRSLGGTFGVSIGSVAINNRLAVLLPKILTPEQATAVINSAAFIRQSLPPALQPQVLEAYVQAMRWVWYSMTGLAGISAVCVVFIKHYSLRRDLDQKMRGDVEEAFTLKDKGVSKVPIEFPTPSRTRTHAYPRSQEPAWAPSSSSRISEKIKVDSRTFTVKKKVLVEKRLWEDGVDEDDDEVIVVVFATEDL